MVRHQRRHRSRSTLPTVTAVPEPATPDRRRRRSRSTPSARLPPAWLFWPFALLVLAAPLPRGSNGPLQWIVLAVATAGLLTLWGGWFLLRRKRGAALRLPKEILWAGAALAAVVAWILIQMAPFTPLAWHHPLWLEARLALGDAARGSVSLNPDLGGVALMRLLTYLGVFWLALQLGQTRTRRRRLVVGLVLAGAAYAVYGLVVDVLAPEVRPDWDVLATPGVSSTFVNRNHYATYAGLGLLGAVGLLVVRIMRDPVLRGGQQVPWPAWLARLLRRQGWLLAALLPIAIALIQTQSRAGVASVALGLAALIALFGVSRLLRPRQVQVLAGLATTAALLLFVFGGDDLAARLEHTDLSGETRFSVYGRVLAAIGDAPGLGTGFGTFAEAFLPYQGRISDGWFDYAHNSYLEAAMEFGLAASLLLLLVVALPVVLCARALPERPHKGPEPALAVAASVLVAAHALLDFSVQIPAVAITWAALLGIGVASVPHRSRSRRALRANAVRRTAMVGTGACVLGMLALAVPRAVALVEAHPAAAVEARLIEGRQQRIGALEAAIAAGERAARWARAGANWHRVAMATLALEPAAITPAEQSAVLLRARAALVRSLGAAPANPQAWAQLAYVGTRSGDLKLVDRALALSVISAPNYKPLLFLRARLALKVWDGLLAPTRALLRAQVVEMARRDPKALAVVALRANRRGVVEAFVRDEPALRASVDRAFGALAGGRS